MSDEWTPSADQVRSHYVFDQNNVWKPERGEAFDRWLAGVRAEERERAARIAESAGGPFAEIGMTDYSAGVRETRAFIAQKIREES